MPTFDGDALVITLDAGVTVLDAEVDLYGAWKDWQLAGNMRFPQAFRTIGGDNLTPGVDAGAYFFIQNDLGWRIKPPEEDITILLTGNLSPEDSALPILIPTTGAFTVLVQGIQPITQNIDSINKDVALLLKIVKSEKEIIKIASSWYLIIYDTGETSGGTEILRKKLTDPSGNDITDLAAGTLAVELENTV